MLRCATVTQSKLPPKQLSRRLLLIEMINAFLNEETGKLMEYHHIMKHPKYFQLYATSYRKELGRLAKGIPGKVEGTNTSYFIDKANIPDERWKDITYGRIVVAYRLKKSDPYQTRLTVGGNIITYPGDCGTPTVDLLTVKLLLNSIISTLGAKFITIDKKYFYLNTPMARYEYMRLKLCNIPEDVTKHYNLATKVKNNGYVYIEIRRGM